VYPEVAVLYRKDGRNVYVRKDDWVRVDHNPWFLIDAPRIPRKMLDRVVRVKETDIDFYAFNPNSWRYERVGKSHYVEVRDPGDVRVLSKALEKEGVRHALSNIRYVARASMDLISELMWYRTPLPVHYSVDELEGILKEIYSRSKSIRVVALDIEVGNEGRFPQIGDPVILAGLAYGELGSDPEIEVLEGEGINDIVNKVFKHEPDYLVGYNIHSFDLPHLRAYLDDARIVVGSQEYYLVDNGKIIPVLDLFKFAVAYGTSLGLKSAISRTLLQVSKDLGVITREEELIEKSINHNYMMREYRENRDKVVKYLETDLKLTFRIAQKWIPVLVILHAITGISPYAQQFLPSMGSLAEYGFTEVLLRKHRICLEVRSRSYDYEEVEDITLPYISKGHKVISVEGAHRNIAQLDFDMLYPTIYFHDRVDPTSVEVEKGFLILLFNDHERRKLRISFAGGTLHEFFSYMYAARRVSKKIKSELGIKEVDQAIKILANASYGVFSKARGSGVNEVVSAYIFFRGNQVLNTVQRIVEQKYGRRVVYGDTDSVFIELREGDDPEKLAESINRDVKVVLGDSFNLKLEDVHDIIVVYGKKNYVALSKSGEVIIKGIHRFPMPVAVKENMHEIVKQVLRGEEPTEVIRRFLLNARIEDLFVSTVKRIEDLLADRYEKKKRFKESVHPSTRALLLSYLVFDIGIVPEHSTGIFTKQVDTKVIIDESLVESGRILSALWLKKQNDTVCILYSAVGDSGADVICGKFYGKPKADEVHLEQRVIVWREMMSRENLSNYSILTSSTLLNILNTIYSIVKGGGR